MGHLIDLALPADLTGLSARDLGRIATRRAYSYVWFDEAGFRALEDEVIARLVRREISLNSFLQVVSREARALDSASVAYRNAYTPKA